MIVFKLNIFEKKLKNSLNIKILQPIFIEYKNMIKQYVDTSELDLLILCQNVQLSEWQNHKGILKYLQKLKRWKNYIVLFVVSIENLKNLKYHTS